MVRNFSSQFTEKIAAVKTKSFWRKNIIIVYKILLPSTHFPIKNYLETGIFHNLAQLYLNATAKLSINFNTILQKLGNVVMTYSETGNSDNEQAEPLKLSACF